MRPKEQQALDTILEAARWGVSADNGQPWKFCWRESHLLLVLDETRASTFFDRRQFAAYLGLGSVVENVCVAASQLGYKARVDNASHFKIPGAKTIFGVSFSTSEAQVANPLFHALSRRSTNRRPYQSTDVATEARTALQNSSSGFGNFRIHLVDRSDLRRKLASLTAASEKIRFDFRNKAVHADFFSCLRLKRRVAERTADGLWVRCLEAGVSGTLGLHFLTNWHRAAFASRLGAHYLFCRQSIYLLRRTPVVAFVLFGNNNSPAEPDFLMAGRLSQRMWLTATAHGLACQPMAVLPLFFAQYAAVGPQGFPNSGGEVVRSVQEEFRQTFGLPQTDHLMMVFRVGYAKAPSARSFRRPLSELLISSDNSPLLVA